MAAPRKFEETEVVERAMLCFWRLGFEGCSISDLVAATNLKRQSLYNAFGSKEGLFERVLAHYQHRVEEGLAPLEDEAAGIEQLEDYFRNFLALQEKLGVSACLVVQAAYGPAMSSPGIARAVRTSASRVRSAFALLLRRVADRNGKNRGIDFVARAAHLYAMLNGLSALAATGADRRLINRGIKGAMLQIETDLRGTGTRRK